MSGQFEFFHCAILANFDHIAAFIDILAQGFNIVFLEGAGGLMAPLQENVLMIDYLQ